jgi:hypothetical protein
MKKLPLSNELLSQLAILLLRATGNQGLEVYKKDLVLQNTHYLSVTETKDTYMFLYSATAEAIED